MDPDRGKMVAKGLGLNLKEIERLARLSQEDRVKATSDSCEGEIA